ncbi:MAG: HAMP domain-containing histidine kinase [Legionellaceae bacterium]|nr:HAMP domain-containing histidine kinase [Legionellaceae bacterium]
MLNILFSKLSDKKRNSLNAKYLLVSLSISIVFLILSMVTVLFIFHQLIQNAYEVAYKQIESIIPEIERSIENEIIIGNKTGIEAVKSYVKSRYAINDIYISNDFSSCKQVNNFINKSVCFTFKIDKFKAPIYLKIVKNIDNRLLMKLLIKVLLFYILFFLLSSFLIYFLLKHFQNLLIKPLIRLSKEPENLNDTHYEIDEIETIRVRLLEFYHKETQSILEKKAIEFKLMLGDIASQVVHDLRAPIASLKYFSSQITYTNKDYQSLFNKCIAQMESISNELLNSKSASSIDDYYKKNMIFLDLSYLLKKEIEDKIALSGNDFINIMVEIKTMNVCVRINPHRFKNILNNLINNSIESIRHRGEVIVSLSVEHGYAKICIADTGRGFPDQVIHSFGKKSITIGKDGGNGIGLFSAYNYLTTIGGGLKISNNQQGAEVTILVPLDTPNVISKTDQYNGLSSVLLDDSQLVLDTWQLRAAEKDINFHAFSNVDSFMNFIDSIDVNSKIYVDSDLGNGLKGEDVARKIYDQGYRNIYLATGFDSVKFGQPYFIKGIVGKAPPF